MKTIADHLLPYRAYLADERQRMLSQIRTLEQENRQDEANLTKIRLNILCVFETVASADEKQSASWEDFVSRYEPRFDTLTAPWRARLASAVRHGDTHTRFVEETKLSTANLIKNVFLSAKE